MFTSPAITWLLHMNTMGKWKKSINREVLKMVEVVSKSFNTKIRTECINNK